MCIKNRLLNKYINSNIAGMMNLHMPQHLFFNGSSGSKRPLCFKRMPSYFVWILFNFRLAIECFTGHWQLSVLISGAHICKGDSIKSTVPDKLVRDSLCSNCFTCNASFLYTV